MNARRVACLLVVLTFLLILWGGVVHNTGSSLACPDWPTCFGSLTPEMTGPVAVEHGHRLLAATVGLLTILLAVLLWRGGDRRLRWLGLSAVFLVMAQGLLGGLTVIFRLPPPVSTAHLAVSFLFFAVIIKVAWVPHPPGTPWQQVKGEGRGWVAAVACLVYLQSVLGAFVRHTGAGLICPEVPLCGGSLWPSHLGSIFCLQMTHRFLGAGVALGAAALPFVLRKRMGELHIALLASGAVIVVWLEIGLGIATILTQKALVPTTAHLGVAALLWGMLVSLFLLTRRGARA